MDTGDYHDHAESIGRFVSDDWVIIGPEGNVIDKLRFLEVIRTGDLEHESMESEESRVRVYGDAAIITALSRSKGQYKGQSFSTHERSTSVYSKMGGRWQCVLTQLTAIAKTAFRFGTACWGACDCRWIGQEVRRFRPC